MKFESDAQRAQKITTQVSNVSVAFDFEALKATFSVDPDTGKRS